MSDYAPTQGRGTAMDYRALYNMVQDKDTRNAGQTRRMRDEILDSLFYDIIDENQADQLLAAIGLKK